MSISKALSDSGWKDVMSKNKIKDNGLLKLLADHKRIDEARHDEAIASLDQIVKLATQMKKTKEVAAASTVAKYVNELAQAAESDRIATAKAKAEAEKKSKAEAEAKKQESKKGSKDDDDGDEDDESSALLTTKMLPLLRQVNKGEMMHVLIARVGKQVKVLMSRKPIAPDKRKILADELGVTGGVKYFGGHCVKEDGATTFVLKSEVSGLAKLLKLALLEQTGMRVKKLSCRGEDGEDADHEEEEGDEVPARGREGGDAPEATRAKEPSPELLQAPEAWDGARELLATNIGALKKAVRAQLADQGDDYVSEIDEQLEKLDRILGRLDRRLTTSLASAAETRDAAERISALRESKGLLAEYIKYVQSEPLIDHVDKNPFGVKTDLKATLSKSLTQLARALG